MKGGASVNFNLERIGDNTRKHLLVALERIGLHAMRESKRNAPRSPTMRQTSATLIRKRRTKRKSTAGGLEKSIAHEVRRAGLDVEARVFVPRNSAAGAYAAYIHDLKGVRWFKRGIGTVRKGARADEKFVERAIKDNSAAYGRAIQGAVESALKEGE